MIEAPPSRPGCISWTLPAAHRAASGLPRGRAGDHGRPRRPPRLRRDRGPASASPMAAHRNTTAWSPTSSRSARWWAAGSLSPRWRAAAPSCGISHHRPARPSSSPRRARSTATRSPPPRDWPPSRSSGNRRLCAALRDGHPPPGRARRGSPRRPGGPGGRRAARVRDLLHGPRHHRLPREPRRGPRASRRVHAGDARRGVVKAAGLLRILAHGAEDVDRTIEIFAAALEAAAEPTH